MADIKQYVNLDPTKSGQLDGLDKARAGKTVLLAATVSPKKPGIPIAFEITHGAQNLARPGHTERRVATTMDDGKATLSYELSEHGGDEFTVKASLALGPKNGAALSSDKYIVWRRLYYQMSRFKAGTPGKGQPDGSVPEVAAYDISPVEAELAARQHNIELVNKTSTALITRYANVMTHDDSSKAYKKSGKDVATIASEIPRRFARLQREYGRWGLAYLESLLRAADYAASASPSQTLEKKA